MRKIVRLVAVIPLVAVSLVFLYGYDSPHKMLGDESLLEAAASLMAAEARYTKARRKSEWGKIYEYQATGYKKAIPYEEFVYYEGKKKPGWVEEANKTMTAQLSGFKTEIPSLEKMRAEIEKTKPKYRFSSGKTIKFQFGDSVGISADGKHARVPLNIDHMFVVMDASVDVFENPDFWDFENNEWRVQLNRWDYRPISGMRKPPGPEIQYETVSLEKIIDYRFKRADALYAKGKKEEAKVEYLRAVELRPLKNYPRAPIGDPMIRNYLKETVLEKIAEWNTYLGFRGMVDSNVASSRAWSQEKTQVHRGELERIKKIFLQK